MPKHPRPQSPGRPRLARSDNLKQEVAKHVRALGASVVGFAPVERWAAHGEVPESYRPEAIWPMARTVVVFGLPMLLPVLESTPSINYQEMYDTSNRLLDDIGYRLATWLCERGHATVFLPRDGYGSLDVLLENRFASFSHTYAAKYAGLGTVLATKICLMSCATAVASASACARPGPSARARTGLSAISTRTPARGTTSN
jgi:epoxyqueuosine reductase QueG